MLFSSHVSPLELLTNECFPPDYDLTAFRRRVNTFTRGDCIKRRNLYANILPNIFRSYQCNITLQSNCVERVLHLVNISNKISCMIYFFYAFFSRDDDNPRRVNFNSDLQRGLDRRLRHTTVNTEQNQ